MESPQKSSEDTNDEKPTTAAKIKNKNKNPRRFSDDQIRSLESIFKMETKLDPRKKLQLARDLGLQPRQIAIWFQNRRARWKSRQIEQEYRVLKTSYDSLYLQFDDLKREKQSLQMQLKELNDIIKNLDLVDHGDTEKKEYSNSSNQRRDHNNSVDDEDKFKNCFKKTEVEEPLRRSEEEEMSHLGSPETWCSLSSYGLFDQPSDSNWWDG